MKNLLHLTTLLLGFFLPIQSVALAIGFFVLVDIATGIWASLKTKQRITSDRFGRSVVKSLVYLTALVVAHVAGVYVFGADIPIVKVVSGLIASTELLSIFENLTRISGIDLKTAIAEKLLPSRPPKDERE